MNIREKLEIPNPPDREAWKNCPLRDASMEKLVETFLAEQKVKFAKSTLEGRVTALKRLRTFMREKGLTKPAELTPQLLWEYERVRSKYFRRWDPDIPISIYTFKQDTVCIRIFLRYLYDEKVLFSDLCSVLNGVHAQRNIPRPLSPATIEQWFRLCDLKTHQGVRDRAIFELIYGSGLRSGEAMSLAVTDLDLAQRQVIIQQTKTKQSRVVPMTRMSVRFLERYLTKVRPWLPRSPKSEHALWLSGYGAAFTVKKLRCRVRRYYRQRVKSGRPLTLHGLRHSFATHLLQSGASIRHVQELLGHYCVNSTQIYTKVAIKDLKDVHRRFHPRG